MSNENVTPPNLPIAPSAYEQRYQDQFANVLRLFFTRLTNKVNSPLPHGSFYDTTTQTNPVANAVNLMKVNSVYDSGGGTQYAVKKDTDRIYITQTGVYTSRFQPSWIKRAAALVRYISGFVLMGRTSPTPLPR